MGALRYTRFVVQALADLITWLGPHALLLALALPPVIRIVGHWIPEEVFMVAIGVLAAQSPSAREAALILGAVTLSHFVTDHAVYLAGRWLRPRLDRFPRIESRLAVVTDHLAASPEPSSASYRLASCPWAAAPGWPRAAW